MTMNLNKKPSHDVSAVITDWRNVTWDISTKSRIPVRHGTACIFHILPTDEFLFFRRSINNSNIPFPGRICLIGGGKKVSDKTPLAALRREISSELTDLTTGLPVRLGTVEHVAQLYDNRPGVIDVYAYAFSCVPHFAINEGDGLVQLSRREVLALDLPYGFTRVVRDYIRSHQVKLPVRAQGLVET